MKEFNCHQGEKHHSRSLYCTPDSYFFVFPWHWCTNSALKALLGHVTRYATVEVNQLKPGMWNLQPLFLSLPAEYWFPHSTAIHCICIASSKQSYRFSSTLLHPQLYCCHLPVCVCAFWASVAVVHSLPYLKQFSVYFQFHFSLIWLRKKNKRRGLGGYKKVGPAL